MYNFISNNKLVNKSTNQFTLLLRERLSHFKDKLNWSDCPDCPRVKQFLHVHRINSLICTPKKDSAANKHNIYISFVS